MPATDFPAVPPLAEVRHRLARARADLLALAALAGLTVLFFWRVLLGGAILLPVDDLYETPPWRAFAAERGVSAPHNPLIADMILQNYSWKRLIAGAYRSGSFPLWNPHLFAGVPFLAAGQYAALYPPGVLFLLAPVEQGYGPFTALHVLLAGAGMYALIRVLGGNAVGGTVGGTAFMFSGFLTVSEVWPMIVSTAAWAP
ncbi:MAG: hypothetical protein HY331_01040, partial [Chloroflexi bacterium]|nr:hypothetical protein [Chloroflexota bacterium]